LSPIYRPRLEYPEEVEAVTKNQLYEREIRLEAERRRIAEWPPIAAILERKREYFAVTHLVGREVYDHIATDSVTLHRYYVANKSFWDLPLRVALTRLTLPDLQAARKMAVTLSDGVSAESLVSLAARSGVRYNAEITAESDSVLFDRAMRARPGSVLGPDQVQGGWEVVRVLAVEPPRARTFAECRILVGQRWYGEEGERRMLELLTRCRKQVRVVENPRAVTLLTSP
jgi:hypothetical protein